MASLTIQTIGGTSAAVDPVIAPGSFAIGVNISGMEYNGGANAKAYYTYAVPSLSELSYYRAQGLDLIRLPISWESLQTTLGGPLTAAYLAEIESVVKNAASLGMKVILDLHDYGGYHGVKIGTSGVTDADFANLWTQLAAAFAGNAGIGGYDLMNEPSGMPTATAWTQAAQAAITAIRTADAASPIYVEGNDYSNAANWSNLNPGLAQLVDPSNNLVFSAHVYLDTDDSGTHDDWAVEAAAGESTNIGVQRLGNFVAWLQANHLQGDIGEVGVGNDNPGWLTALDATLGYAAQNDLQVTYWAAGPWWGSYPMSVEPYQGLVAPQQAVLDKYSGDDPTVTAAVIAGTTGANQLVYISENGILLGTATANGAGAWSDTLGGLASGVHIIVAGDNLPTVDGTIAATVFDLVAPPPTVIDESGIGEIYIGRVNNVMSSNHIINVSGVGDSGVIFAGDYDTLNLTGTAGVFLLQSNDDTVAGSDVPNTVPDNLIGSAINLTGANSVAIYTGYNTIDASDGATVLVEAGNNTVSGSGMVLQLEGGGNVVNVSGADSIQDASPWNYQTSFSADPSQSYFTVQGGQISLGGMDRLLQTEGAAQLNLFGGDSVTLDGANDTVAAEDQVYGGNDIANNGANNQIFMTDVAGRASTIIASASTAVNIADAQGAGIGKAAGDVDTGLLFIGGTHTADSIFAAGSSAAVTLNGGASAGDLVYGGAVGNNSLNGGSGGGDLLVAGGNGDVLIAGGAGNNTLVAGRGNETLIAAARGNDLISITGGGGVDLIDGFSGTLQLGVSLSLVQETSRGGALQMSLSDGTRLVFAGVTGLAQRGDVFSR
jgi:aryl-phospho-beta-D-glucosidase BglC (GH1 family)